MYDNEYLTKRQNVESILSTTSNFKLRQAVERLREGLFDPLGVKLLTTGEAALNRHFEASAGNLERGKAVHLCVCGAYGQGKSHSLNYLRQRGLEENFVVADINLDPREVPFHNLKQVYRAIMERLAFPGNNGKNSLDAACGLAEFDDIWKRSVKEWLALPDNISKTVADMIPEAVPHRFKSILTAMAQPTESIPNGKRRLKRHAAFKPREFPWILLNALAGKDIPVARLRHALKYRQVSFYNDRSLACRDPRAYLDAIKGYGALFRKMGYRGLMVMFDEAESIMLATIGSRAKSYSILHEIFCPQQSAKGFFPVFAFTDDFFAHLGDEDFERVKKSKNREQTEMDSAPARLFARDYSDAWKGIAIHRLRNLNAKEWRDIIIKLIHIHASAYGWTPDVDAVDKKIVAKLSAYSDAESRLKLKLIVNALDIEQQRILLSTH